MDLSEEAVRARAERNMERLGIPKGGAVFPAYLGWGNPDRDNASVRLYATDLEPPTAPRWDRRNKGGRVVEYAITDALGAAEGDRFLVVRVGDRFTSPGRIEQVRQAIIDALS